MEAAWTALEEQAFLVQKALLPSYPCFRVGVVVQISLGLELAVQVSQSSETAVQASLGAWMTVEAALYAGVAVQVLLGVGAAVPASLGVGCSNFVLQLSLAKSSFAADPHHVIFAFLLTSMPKPAFHA